MQKTELKEGSLQHQLIVKAALEHGFEADDLSTDLLLRTKLSTHGKQFTLTQGIIDEWVNKKAIQYCDFKQSTKEMLAQLDIPHPISHAFESTSDLTEIDMNQHKNFICKPEVSTNGIGVSFNIRTLEDIQNYLSTHKALGPRFLLEEFVPGSDLRIQIIGGKVVAVCIRIPAEVVGDEKTALNELIEQRKAIIQKQNPSNRLDVDQETKLLLAEQKVELSDIIESGQKIQLKRIANMGQGATAMDCTSKIDPKLHHWINKMSDFLETGYFAVDIITDDISSIKNYKVLEINLKAEWLHHTFSQGRTHDVAKTIVQELINE